MLYHNGSEHIAQVWLLFALKAAVHKNGDDMGMMSAFRNHFIGNQIDQCFNQVI